MAYSTPLRRYAGIFAGILGLFAVWICAAEITRPTLPFFPSGGAEGKGLSSHAAAAAAVAIIGWPRGDLWVDNAMVENSALLADIQNGSGTDNSGESFLRTAERAAALAPSDARAWVILAALSEESPTTATKALAQLKMSYYTSPYNEALFPIRIQIAARSTAGADEELHSYLKYELGTVVSKKPAYKLSVASAYKMSTPAGQQLLESLFKELNLSLQ
jgi:hypothetical protein